MIPVRIIFFITYSLVDEIVLLNIRKVIESKSRLFLLTCCTCATFMRTLSAFIILLFFGVANIAAQTTFRVISATDHASLPYATIVNTTQRTMHSSDDSGFVKMNVHTGDTINVTYIGYFPAMMISAGEANATLMLQRDPKILKPVRVETCKSYEHFAVKNFTDQEKQSLKGPGSGGVEMSIGPGAAKARIAALIASFQPDAQISKFTFWIKNFYGSPDTMYKSPLLISFYDVSDSTGLPGDLLTDAPIIYFPKKPGRQTIDTDSLHISVPKEGIYVCFQWVIDERYQWKYNLITPEKKDSIGIRQGGLIDGVQTDSLVFVFYDLLNNKWFRGMPFHKTDPVTKERVPYFNMLRYEAVLKYCK